MGILVRGGEPPGTRLGEKKRGIKKIVRSQ
jgi:hypothetical protein